jgi:hypothetical protein
MSVPHLNNRSSVSTVTKNFEQPKLTLAEMGLAARLARGR